MRKHWSLVLFTLLVQSAVGSVWCVQAALFFNGGRIGLIPLKFQIIAALCGVAAGLAVAMTHLGNPGDSRHAIRNFKSSWLSREIFTVNLFAGILAAMAALSHFNSALLNGWAMLVASFSGATALYAMTGVYRLKTVPSWNHAGTPLNFLGSALLLGGLLSMSVLKMLTLLQAMGHDASGLENLENTAFVFVLAGLILKMIAAAVSPSGADTMGPFKTLQPVMQGCGFAFWSIYLISGGSPGLQWVLLFLAAVSLVAGEIIHRSRFYDAYQRVGL
jgi:DMSO reductase anchor subunit